MVFDFLMKFVSKQYSPRLEAVFCDVLSDV